MHKDRPQAPKGHQWVETQDQTFTLFSEKFQEACHSTSGAREETLLHYVNGCKILEKSKSQETLTILEVGFGLGVGFLTTFDFLENSPVNWKFISLEIDENLLEWFRLENTSHPFLKNLEWSNKGSYRILEARTPKCQLTILSGDARVCLPLYLEKHSIKWDAIYQDAFSPKKNPVLWTVEWFKLLKDSSQEDVILSTYSASNSIRKSLIEASWVLHKGEKFGAKRTSTRATLQGSSDPEILYILDRSPVFALRDELLISAQKEIP